VFEYFVGVLYGFALLSGHLSCAFVPICPCIEARWAWRVLSTSVDASLMIVVMALSWRRGGRPSNSSHGMRFASLRMRSVGNWVGF
jgi:hypothetical protein